MPKITINKSLLGTSSVPCSIIRLPGTLLAYLQQGVGNISSEILVYIDITALCILGLYRVVELLPFILSL